MQDFKLGPGSSWAKRYGAPNGPHRGAEIGPRKWGLLAWPKMSKNGTYPQGYSSMMARRRHSTFSVGPNGGQVWAVTYLVPKDVRAPSHGNGRNRTYKCQNGKIVHTHLDIAPCEWALRYEQLLCESWGPNYISYIQYVVHWSMCMACTGGAGASARRAENIRNGRKWPTMRTLMVGTWTRVCPRIGTNCYVSNIPFGSRPNPPLTSEPQGHQVNP